MQLSHSKALEIEDLLGRLSDVNDSLSSSLSGASDPRSHTLARHRDILHDYTQVSHLTRMASSLAAAKAEALPSLHWWQTCRQGLKQSGSYVLQEFRRLQSALGAAKDRAELFAGSSEASPMQVKFLQTAMWHISQDCA